MARALCETPAALDFRSAARAGGGCAKAPPWPGYQRRSRPRGAAIARVSFDAAFHGAGLQRGYPEEEAASGAAAARAAANGDEGGLLRLCWRRAAGRGDGAERRGAGDRRAWPFPDGETPARGTAGVPHRLAG